MCVDACPTASFTGSSAFNKHHVMVVCHGYNHVHVHDSSLFVICAAHYCVLKMRGGGGKGGQVEGETRRSGVEW
jgi:hypothetical protein